jgi:hypothetical protein
VAKEQSTKSKIWCLFSVDNNYDQPNNNLVAWWSEKPSLEILGSALGVKLGEKDSEAVFLVNVWTGKNERHPDYETNYRLEDVAEGRILNDV